MSQHDTLTLEQALRGLLATGGVIAEASDEDLQAAIDDPHAEEIIKTQAAAILKARAALSATQPAQAAQSETALQKFTRLKVAEEEDSPVEQLRVFCSYAMNGQDWLDVEPFFDAINEAQAAQSSESPCACWPGRMCSRSAECAAQASQGEQEAELRRSLAAAEATLSERNTEIISLHKRLKAAQGAGEVVTVISKFGDLCTFSSSSVRKGDKLYTQPAAGADVLLDALRDNSWDLVCFERPTGGDDADIGWRVIEHHMAKPNERVIAGVFKDDPGAAIRAAIAASGRQE